VNTRLLPDARGFTSATRRILVGVRMSASRWIAIGLALFAIGLAFIAVDVLPFFAGDTDTPLWLNLACLLAPLGFAVAVWSALRSGRDEQRAALRELSDG
jgi:uncharacterized membrane protein YhdT